MAENPALIYRRDRPPGPENNLTPGEVDGNFEYLFNRLGLGSGKGLDMYRLDVRSAALSYTLPEYIKNVRWINVIAATNGPYAVTDLTITPYDPATRVLTGWHYPNGDPEVDRTAVPNDAVEFEVWYNSSEEGTGNNFDIDAWLKAQANYKPAVAQTFGHTAAGAWIWFDGGTTPPVPTLATPTNFTATAVSSSQIDLSITAVPNATAYTYQRSVDSNFTSPQTIYSGPSTTVQNVSGLSPSTQYFYRVWATAEGYTQSDYALANATTLAINPVNTAPIANAGTDQTITLPTNAVTLTGSGSDADGSIVAYAWTKQSGPGAGVITSPNAANTTVTGLTQGTYVFRLTVTDNGTPALTASDVVQVIVSPVIAERLELLGNYSAVDLDQSISVLAGLTDTVTLEGWFRPYEEMIGAAAEKTGHILLSIQNDNSGTGAASDSFQIAYGNFTDTLTHEFITINRTNNYSHTSAQFATGGYLVPAGSSFVNTDIHWALVIEPNVPWKFFLNGQEKPLTKGNYPNGTAPTLTGFLTGLATPTRFQLGARWLNTARVNNLKGQMWNVRLWNTARLEEQLVAGMTTSYLASEPGLVEQWLINEGSGTVAQGTKGNHGTIINGHWIASNPGNTTPAPPTFTNFMDTDAGGSVSLVPAAGIPLTDYRYILPGSSTPLSVPDNGVITVGDVAGSVSAYSVAATGRNQSPAGSSPAFTVYTPPPGSLTATGENYTGTTITIS